MPSIGFFEMKTKYDESDNVLIRASRALTDKVTDLLGECGFKTLLSLRLQSGWNVGPNLRACLPAGGLFSKTEMSEVLTEILRADPKFDKDRFLRQCESDIIPNILEVRSMLQLWGSPGLLHPSLILGGYPRTGSRLPQGNQVAGTVF